MAALSVLRLSCGEPLLSKPTTSNLTPAGFLPESFSAANCQLLSWFWPTLANGPERGSMNAMRTVSPFCANAVPAARAMAVTAMAFSVNFIACSLVCNNSGRVPVPCAGKGQGLPVKRQGEYRLGDRVGGGSRGGDW